MSGQAVLSSVAKARLLDEMLGGVAASPDSAGWSVLVMDEVTTRVMSYTAGIADVFDYGVSLVDDVRKTREPLLHQSAVYFLTPSEQSVSDLLRDWEDRDAYGSAHVFFSSPLPPHLLTRLRQSSRLVPRLRSLRELNLEFLALDARCFSTAQDGALCQFFGANAELGSAYREALQTTAARLATLFISLREHPAVRFRAALPPGEDFPPGVDVRLLGAQRLAVELHERLTAAARSGLLPEAETCELVLADRALDVVAPAIHEWTYEAMAHDLLGGTPALQGRVFTYESSAGAGKDRAEHRLDERDPLFAGLRHEHIAAASLAISREMDAFKTGGAAAAAAAVRNAAPVQPNSLAEGSSPAPLASAAAQHQAAVPPAQPVSLAGADLRAMGRLVKSLPQYREALARLAAHVELASRVNAAVEAGALAEAGKLEQDLVYGDVTSKEVIALLSARPELPPRERVRLLLCYSATHLEKLDAARAGQWQKVARLGPKDLAPVANLEFLGVPVFKRDRGGGLGFGRRRRRAVRKDRDADGGQYALSRFVPLLAEVMEDALAGKLSADEYPFVAPPRSPLHPAGSDSTDPPSRASSGVVASARTLRATGNWAKKTASAATLAAGGAGGELDAVKRAQGASGRRLFVFVLGGVTHSEMRAAHKLSAKTGREVLVGGTHVETPGTYLEALAELSMGPEEALNVETPLRKQFQ